MTNKEKRKPRSFYRFKTLFFVGIAVTALGMIMYIGGQLGFRAKISSVSFLFKFHLKLLNAYKDTKK